MPELNLDEIRAHIHTDNTAMLRDMCQSLLAETRNLRINLERSRNRSVEIATQMEVDHRKTWEALTAVAEMDHNHSIDGACAGCDPATFAAEFIAAQLKRVNRA